MSETTLTRRMYFHSDAAEGRTFRVGGFQGTEAVSRLYRFEVTFLSEEGSLEFAPFLEHAASIGFEQKAYQGAGKVMNRIWGRLITFQQREKTRYGIRYEAVLVPRLWRLSLTVQNRIFQDQSVPSVIEQLLKEHGFEPADYDLSGINERSYPKKEYFVQFQESDLDLLQRLCEHEGIYFFFDQQDEKEVVVFADQNGSFLPIAGKSRVRYQPIGPTVPAATLEDETSVTGQGEVIHDLTVRQDIVPGRVELQDYNYRNPRSNLTVSQPVDGDVTLGHRNIYGDHYKDADEGKTYARIRAEEIHCRRWRLVGRSDVRSFRAGGVFEFRAHYREDIRDRKYVITEVTHTGQQPLDPSVHAGADYENEFVAIPLETPFRPERITPKPRTYGVMNAKVDAASGEATYADVDQEGRYRVVFPWDNSGRGGALKPTRRIRMVQPHAGKDEGFHHPLRVGTEVPVTYVNGDLDRPLIHGALFHGGDKIPLTEENATQCVIKAFSNNAIVFENTVGEESVTITSPFDRTFITMGAANKTSAEQGLRGFTKGNIQLQAEKYVSIVAGASSEEETHKQTLEQMDTIDTHTASIVAGIALAGAVSLEATAMGWTTIKALATSLKETAKRKPSAVAAAAGGFIDIGAAVWGGLSKSVLISAPGKVALLGTAEVVAGSAGCADIVAGGCASMLAGASALVGALASAGVIAMANTEMVALFGNVLIEAKMGPAKLAKGLGGGDVNIEANQNVKIEAVQQDVIVEAKKRDIKIEAEKNVEIVAKEENVTIEAKKKNLEIATEGMTKIRTKKGVDIENTDSGTITITFGDSGIAITKQKIVLEAPTIEVTATKTIKMSAKTLDLKGCKKIDRPSSEEK